MDHKENVRQIDYAPVSFTGNLSNYSLDIGGIIDARNAYLYPSRWRSSFCDCKKSILRWGRLAPAAILLMSALGRFCCRSRG